VDRQVDEAVAAIWKQILGVETLGLHDDFFEMGGHSLLAMQLLARLHDAFQVDLTVGDVFEAPTGMGLAAKIEEELRAGHGGQAPPIARASRDRELPLSFAQQRLWFLDQLSPGSAEYNVSTALRVIGRLDLQVLAASLGEIVRRHEVLRTI